MMGKNLNLGYLNNLGHYTDVYSHNDRSSFIVRDVLNVYPGIVYREVNKTCKKIGVCNEYESSSDSLDICSMVDCELCPQKFDWENKPKEYDFKASPSDLITAIEYYQYVAYWRWRIRMKKYPIKHPNPVVSNYIPSKEEFEKIQNEEALIHPKEVHNLPTPSFRYVVKFY